MKLDEFCLELSVEALPEGGYLASSDDFPGLVAQGRTMAETLEIAKDVARRLVESHLEHGDPLPPKVRAALKSSPRKTKLSSTASINLGSLLRSNKVKISSHVHTEHT